MERRPPEPSRALLLAGTLMLNEAWPAARRADAVQLCFAEVEGDGPAAPPPRLSAQQLRRLQLELIRQIANLDNSAVVAILPAAAREARTNSLRTRVRQDVDALIQCIRDNPTAATDAIPFPPGTGLSTEHITQIRNYINNNQQAALNTLRDQIVQARLDDQLPAAFRALLRERLQSETNRGTFGPLSRATYNRVSTWLRQGIIDTLQNLDDRMMAFPPGCPVEPPRSPISNRHVSDELFRAMIRRMRPGEPGTDINFQLPAIGADNSPTPVQFEQLWKALIWFRDANELLSPIREESQRQIISDLITRFNRPGWARDRYPNVEQWQPRAQAMVNLESQMHACAELIVNLHNRFNTFPLDGVVGGHPPFPGQIQVQNGRVTSCVPDLPATLDLLDPENLSIENRKKIEKCLEWLEHHGLRVNRQLARIFSDGANIYMLGDHATGDFTPAERAALNARLPENVRNRFNLVTQDFEVQPGPNNTFRVTPVTRYRKSPWYNYLNRIVDGTVYEERGATETLRAGELVLVNRSGRFELMAVENLSRWRSDHTTWRNIQDGVTAAVDLSMIVLGGVEAKAAWTAAGRLLATAGPRAGMSALRRRMIQTLATRGGLFHMGLGGTGFLTSAYWRDPDVHILGMSGGGLVNARHYVMLADGGLMLTSGRSLGQIGTHRAIASRTQHVIAESFWLRNLQRLGELDVLPPIPYIRLSPSAGAAMRLSEARIAFAHLRTGHYALPTLQVGLSIANMFGMVRDGRPPTGNTLDPAGLMDRMPETPFFARYFERLLTNANVDQAQITRLLGFITDNRPPRNPPERRLGVEQNLIDQFNGATERERIAIGTVLLLEAARNTSDKKIPPHLGEGARGIASQTVRDFLASRFRESQDPEIRLLAAQGLLAIQDITPQEFAAFCVAMAKNQNLPKEARAQAIMGVALCMTMAGVAEGELANRLQTGHATVEDAARYLVDSFGVTQKDLQACLESIARQSGCDRDLRALAAAGLNAAKLGNFQQSMSELQRLATAWHAAKNRPAGSFAIGQVGRWAQDLTLPVRFTPSDPARSAQNMRRIFLAAKALSMLSDTSFRPIWQAHNAALAANALSGALDAGWPGFLQPASAAARGIPLSPEALNDAFIKCVDAADPEIALQALVLLAPNVSTLRANQVGTLRDAVRLLLGRLSLPQQGYRGAQGDAVAIDALTGLLGGPPLGITGLDEALVARSAEEQAIRTRCRVQIIKLLPELFATAPDNIRARIIPQLTATLVPRAGSLEADNPDLRQAAAIALGRLLVGRSVARSHPSNPNDPTPLGRLELALQDSSPLVRLAAIEALLLIRPARLSNDRTLQQLCADLLITERDPAVLALLRRAEFLERAPDPTSPDYMDDFQRARYDLLFSLNCRGPRSLAGAPAFILNPARNLTYTHHLTPDRATYAPYNQPYHSLNARALQELALGNGPHAMDALKALIYIVVSRGRPFELRHTQASAVDNAAGTLLVHCRNLDVVANPQRAQDLLWAMELCLVLHSGLDRAQRLAFLNAYMQLVQRMPADAQRRHRAGVVASIVLQKEAVSWCPANEQRASNDLQLACIRYIGTYRTRAALPVLELIVRNNRPGPVLDAARATLHILRSDPQVVAPGTRGGPLPGTVAFDDAYDTLRRQLLDGNNGLFLQPGRLVRGRFNDFIEDPADGPGRDSRQRALLISFANSTWFTQQRISRYAPNVRFLWWQSHQFNPVLPEPREAGQTPQGAMNDLIALARRDGSDAQGARRQEELDAQKEARICLAWIVAVNGDGLVHFQRDDLVRQAAAALADISGRRLQGLADLDSVIEAALVGQPFMDRRVRDHLVTALWNRRASNRGSIANERVALILAGALRSEFLSTPRPDEPDFAASRNLQIRILGYLETLGHRMCAPIVEALSLHHPVAEVRNRATQTLIALHDNVWRVWDRARQPAAIDSTTLPAARAQALRLALRGNSEHDGLVQAMFNAYLGRPILANDPRHDIYIDALADRRAHVKLAAALVILRAENTGFTQRERDSAMAVAADAALHGIHIGLRNSGRSILADNVPNGRFRVQTAPGTTVEIVKNAGNPILIEIVNGRVTNALVNGTLRRPDDTTTPPLLEFVFRDSRFSSDTRLAAASSWFTSNHNDMTAEAYNPFLLVLIQMADSTDSATRNKAIRVMADAFNAEWEQMTSVGQSNRGQRQLLLIRALAQIDDPVAREVVRKAAIEHPHFLVRREASRAYSNFTLQGLSTALARPLTEDTVIAFDLITDERDWRRHWLTDNPASGVGRIGQLFALIDRRSTAVPFLTKQLAINALIPLAVDGNPDAFTQGSWIFRTLDPALAPAAIFELNLRLGREMNALAGQPPSLEQRQKIERCLELILAVCRSSPLTKESLARLQTTLTLGSHNHFVESTQMQQIVELMATSATAPIIESNDARLYWLSERSPLLRFTAARDCLLPSSTVVSPAQRASAIQALAQLYVQGNSQMRSQCQTLLSGLTGPDANTALDALANIGLGIRGRNPVEQEQLLRCWTLSVQLCESAGLPEESERFLRARLERRRLDASADDQELRDLQIRLNDCMAQRSYEPDSYFSLDAVERYSVALLAAERDHGRDSLEAARIELALAKAAHSRSLHHQNATARRNAADLALRCARHAYQVLALRSGPDASETCDALYRLGIIEVGQNRLADGIGHLNEALRAYKRNPAQIGLAAGAWITSQLAQAYIRNGDFTNADRISGQLLKMASGSVAVEHRLAVHTALSNLAESYVRFARPPRPDSAERLWRRALDLARSSWGESHPRTLESMLMLAQNLAAQGGRNEAATNMMERAMTLFGAQTDLFAIDRSRIHRAHARALMELGRLRESLEASRRSREASLAPAR